MGRRNMYGGNAQSMGHNVNQWQSKTHGKEKKFTCIQQKMQLQ